MRFDERISLLAAPLARARFLREHGELDAALAAVEYRGDAEASIVRSACALDREDYNMARIHLERARVAGCSEDISTAPGRETMLVSFRMALVDGRAQPLAALLERMTTGTFGSDDAALSVGVQMLIWSAVHAVKQGDLERARAQTERVTSVLRRSKAPPSSLEAQLLVIRARLALQDPLRFGESIELAGNALRLACDAHVPFVATSAAMVIAEAATAIKDHQAALHATDTILTVASTITDPCCRFAHLLRAQLFPLVGRTADARDELICASEELPANHPHQAPVALTKMTSLARHGRYGELERLVADSTPHFASSDNPLYGLYLMFRGIAAAGTGDQPSAATDLSDAVDLLESHRNANYLAAVYPVAFRIIGNRRFALASKQLFRDTPSTSGRSAPNSEDDRSLSSVENSHALTARQREVALLAADGLSNKEIASRLRITPKTVTHHLEAVFGCLELRSRWQLREALHAQCARP